MHSCFRQGPTCAVEASLQTAACEKVPGLAGEEASGWGHRIHRLYPGDEAGGRDLRASGEYPIQFGLKAIYTSSL